MRPVLRRIAIHGGLTAGLLALMGLLFVEMAGIWMEPPAGPRGGPNIAAPESAKLRIRVPLTMAAWGFIFVAGGELLASRFRRKRTPPPPPATDDTEKRLQELLAKIEGKVEESQSPAAEHAKKSGLQRSDADVVN